MGLPRRLGCAPSIVPRRPLRLNPNRRTWLPLPIPLHHPLKPYTRPSNIEANTSIQYLLWLSLVGIPVRYVAASRNCSWLRCADGLAKDPDL